MGPIEMQNKFLSRLKKSKDNMFILVDTRLAMEQDDSIDKRLGQPCVFNSLASNARGVAVFWKDSLDITDVKLMNVLRGNYSRLSFTHNKERYLVKCLYAPNKDSSEDDDSNESSTFFAEVFKDN